MNIRPLKIMLAGGGTGGHVIPAIAIAEEVIRRGGEVRFVGTSDRIEARLVPEAGFGIDFIKVKPLAGGGMLKLISGLSYVPSAIIAAMQPVRSFAPDAVIGVGGYVAGPVVLAARLMGIPTAVLEQNATVGLANKIVSKLIRRAFVTYKSTVTAFPAGRVVISGNPVRQQIIDTAKKPKPKAEGDLVNILVMGGSQGALTIDDRVPAACEMAKLGGQIKVLHQCGKGRENQVEAAYSRGGVEAKAVDFITDTAAKFLNADLVVARAGATTVSELTVMGLPAVFLPYPHHKDKQQEKNAKPMADIGAAIIIDEKTTGPRELSEAISKFVMDEEYRSAASKASRSLGHPDAAKIVVDGLMQLKKNR